MKSKSLFFAVLMIIAFSQFSFTVFAVDKNQKLFDKAWDNVLSLKRYSNVCTISVPFAKIDPKLKAVLSVEEKKRAKFDVESLKKYKSYVSGLFNEKDHISYLSLKTLDVFNIAAIYTENKLTFEQAMASLNTDLVTNNIEVITGVGDKVYYKLNGDWKIFEDYEFATKDYDRSAGSSFVNFLDRDTLVFADKVNGRSIYYGKAGEDYTENLIGIFDDSNFTEIVKQGDAKLFVNSKGDWKKLIIEAKFNFNNVVATARAVCDFDFTDKKVVLPSNPTPVDKETGLKDLAG